jgi:hypothetical protein
MREGEFVGVKGAIDISRHLIADNSLRPLQQASPSTTLLGVALCNVGNAIGQTGHGGLLLHVVSLI